MCTGGMLVATVTQELHNLTSGFLFYVMGDVVLFTHFFLQIRKQTIFSCITSDEADVVKSAPSLPAAALFLISTVSTVTLIFVS